MVMGPCFDKHGRKKGAWSEDEDNKLRAYIERYGHYNWRELPKLAGLSRCGKSCRLRWKNYLSPNVKLGNFLKEEEDVIVGLQNKLGNRWSRIAERLPGRSDNEIKNHWHAHLKTRTQIEQTMSKDEHIGSLKTEKTKPEEEVTLHPIPSSDQLPSIFVTSSSSLSDSHYATSSRVGLQSPDYILEGDFWSESFLLDDYSIYPSDTFSSSFGFVNDFIFEAFWQNITTNDSTFF